MAGSRPDIRRASEKKEWVHRSGLGGGNRRCWWQWRWWNCVTSELTVHCEQRDCSYTTKLNTSSTGLWVAAELLLITGRFTSLPNSWTGLLIHLSREKACSWWPERPDDVSSGDTCSPGTELDVSRWVSRFLFLLNIHEATGLFTVSPDRTLCPERLWPAALTYCLLFPKDFYRWFIPDRLKPCILTEYIKQNNVLIINNRTNYNKKQTFPKMHCERRNWNRHIFPHSTHPCLCSVEVWK